MKCKICEREFHILNNLSKNRIYCYVCMPTGTRSSQLINLKNAVKRQLVYLNGNKCKVCGYNKYNGALEFHHLDKSTKIFSIGTTSKRDFQIILNESKKCILLCSNCHKELHAGIINM